MTESESSSLFNYSFQNRISTSFTKKHLRKIVFLLFFFSGIAGLIYEIVWTRALVLVFGSTSFAISTVLTSYMAGLALGGYLFGKLIDRREDQLKIYGLLVTGTGVYAVILPFILKAVSPLYSLIYRGFGVNFAVLSIFRFIISLTLLIVPTTLMGGTLPTLTRFMTRQSATVRINLGRLYSLNTFGAVLGCFLSAFFFLPFFGMMKTILIASTIDILAGFIAILLYRKTLKAETEVIHYADEKNIHKVTSAPDIPAWFLKIILILFAFSGFASLAYEVLWTRLLVFYISNNIYAFSIMLTIFLLGITLGSYIFERFFRKTRSLIIVFIFIEFLIGFTGFLSIPILIGLRSSTFALSLSTPFWSATVNTIAKALSVMAIPTILIGIAFPLVNTIYAGNSKQIGGRVGNAYSLNNIGSIFGSVTAGFIIVPFLGTRLGLITIATINIAISLAAFTAFSFWRKRFTYPALILSIIAIILLPQTAVKLIGKRAYAEIFHIEKDSKLSYLKEGIGGTVTIEEFPDYRTISINGVNVAGTNKAFHTTQKLQAHLALLLHPEPKQVMQIGFGSGGTAYSASLHDVERIDCVEISPVVLEAAPHFQETNKGILSSPKVHVFVDDARSYMRHTDKKYDVILSDSTHPIVAGNGALYTVDYFRQCYDRLNENGIFSTWLPVYDLRAVDFKVILNSLCEVFPYVYLWHTSIGRNEWTIVHGFKRELLIDFAQLETKISRKPVKQDLKQIYIKNPIDILSLFLMPKTRIKTYISGIEILNTDDNAYIEFTPARYAASGTRLRLFREAFAELIHYRVPAIPIIAFPPEDENQLIEKYKNAYYSMTSVLRGRLYEMWGNRDIAEEQFQHAIKLHTGNYVAKDLLGILKENKQAVTAKIKNAPNDELSRIDLALYYFFNGDYEVAWEQFEIAIAIAPSEQYAYLMSTLCSIFLKDYDTAIDTTVRLKNNVCKPDTLKSIENYRDIIYKERELKYRPDDVNLIADLAFDYMNIGRFQKSLKYISKGLGFSPKNVKLLQTKLFIERILCDPVVIETSQTTLSVEPDNMLAKNTLEIIDKYPSNPFIFFDLWREQLEEDSKLESQNIPGSQKEAYELYQKGMKSLSESKHEEALTHLKKALSAYPERKEISLSIAEICLFIKKYDAGIDAIQKTLKYIYNDEELKTELLKLRFHKKNKGLMTANDYLEGALIYLRNGEYEEGLPYLLKALEINPDIENGLINLGSYYMSTGQLDKAKELYEKVIEKTPEDENLNKVMKILDAKMGKKESPESENIGADE